MTETYAWPVLAIVIFLNLVGFMLVGQDKTRSVARGDRFPEVYFFFLSTFFASLGVLLGMYVFRHKTQKLYFPLGIGLLLLEQVLLIYFAYLVLGTI